MKNHPYCFWKLDIKKGIHKEAQSKKTPDGNKKYKSQKAIRRSSKIKLQKNKGEDEAIKQFLINSQIELKHIEIEYTEVDELQKGCTDQCFGDVLFYSELKRLNHPENQSKVSAKKKYINKFCTVSKTDFRCYQSEESFLSSEDPISVIEFSKMNLVSMIIFKIDKNFEYKFSTKLQFIRKKALYYFIIMYSNELRQNNYEIFASEDKEIIHKWISIINYCIDH